MKKLSIYLGKSYIFNFIWAAIFLTALFSLFELSEQLENVGRGDYDYVQAVYYVFLTMPNKCVELSPFAAFLGAVVSVGIKSGNRELLALQACGISWSRICSILILSAFLLAFFLIVFSEVWASSWSQKAYKIRSTHISEEDIFLWGKGFWAQKGYTFLHVGSVQSKSLYKDVYIYSFNQKGRLETLVYAQKALLQRNNKWKMSEVTQKEYSREKISKEQYKDMVWKSFLDPAQRKLLQMPAHFLSYLQLYRIVNASNSTNRDIDKYQLVFWQKVVTPLAILGLTVLALPLFVCKINVQRPVGLSLLLGVILGGLFYLLLKLLGYLSLVCSVHPALMLLLPVLFILLVSLVLLYRKCGKFI